MAEIVTAGDLYSAVSQLVAQYRHSPRTLEEYLRALWAAAHRHRDRDSLTPDEMFGLLATAFIAEPYPFEAEVWLESYDTDAPGFGAAPGFGGWERRVAQQVVDLLEMEACGQLADEQRYFGIDAPRGSRWYNFDPATYLECAVAGTFGGRLVAAPRPLGNVAWDAFRDFLDAGQGYE